MKKTRTLGFKLVILFLIALLLILGSCGIVTYLNQMSIYRDQCETDVRNVGEYLETLIQADGKDFARYQDYYLEHYDEVDIPIDADEYVSYRTAYEKLFHKTYPGKTLDVDIAFEDLDEDVQHAYFVYRHLYWLLTFEKARKDFDLPYTYYLVPDTENYNVIYMIDGERSSRADHIKFITESPEYKKYDHPQGDEKEFMYLNDEYHNDRDTYNVEWDAWESGEKPKGFQIWKNAWGDTYACYTPVIIDGQKKGLVGTEVDIDKVNTAILENTIRQFLVIGLILLAGMLLMVVFINHRYIRAIANLESKVRRFAETKNASVAQEIKDGIRGENEISSLSREVAQMILEIQEYIISLGIAHQELDQANDNAARLSELALKDGLTGIRNHTAYQKEKDLIDKQLSEGDMEFAIVVADLNNLKKINDTYGHEKGDEAIIRLAGIICGICEHSMIFRVGGDEFAAILVDDDYRNREELIRRMHTEMDALQEDDTLQPWEKVSAAIGLAAYEPEEDSKVIDVFRRADAQMYDIKKEMKVVRS